MESLDLVALPSSQTSLQAERNIRLELLQENIPPRDLSSRMKTEALI